MLGVGKGVATLAVVASIIFGWKFYLRSMTHETVHEAVINTCRDDERCRARAAASFDFCFERHYSLGGMKPSGLDFDGFFACVDKAVSRKLFTSSSSRTL